MESPGETRPQAAACMPWHTMLRLVSRTPLRRAGGAAAEEDHRDVAGPHRGGRRRGVVTIEDVLPPCDGRIGGHRGDRAPLRETEEDALCEGQVVRDAGEQDPLHGSLGRGLPEGGVEGVEADGVGAAAHAEIEGDLPRRREGMDEGARRSDPARGVQDQDALRAGGQGDEETRPLLHPERMEAGRAALDVGEEGAVRRRPAEELPGRGVRVPLDRPAQRLVEGDVGIVERRGNAPVGAQPRPVLVHGAPPFPHGHHAPLRHPCSHPGPTRMAADRCQTVLRQWGPS